MNPSRRFTILVSLLLGALFTGSILAQHAVEGARGKEATLEEVLYLPSSKALKRLSLGYSSLLADIYWTRAVQYFGSKHIQHSQRYDLLYPLLDITTDLDPNLIVAYQNGALFLSQSPPMGAGQPDKAVALLKKGIRENPDYWRLYFTLGFVHYIDRDDPEAAEQAFQKGSEIPGALPWMKVMAARMAERSKDAGTAMMLWKTVLETSSDKDVKKGAQIHLASIQADIDITSLERLARQYRQQTGSWPGNWTELIRSGFLRQVPLDPDGSPYTLKSNGRVEVQDASKYPYLGEWRYNEERPF